MTSPSPLYYLLLSGASGEWANLSRVEIGASLPPTAHPHHRKLLRKGVEAGHLEERQEGARVLYRLTRLGEDFLDDAWEVFGPPPRRAILFGSEEHGGLFHRQISRAERET